MDPKIQKRPLNWVKIKSKNWRKHRKQMLFHNMSRLKKYFWSITQNIWKQLLVLNSTLTQFQLNSTLRAKKAPNGAKWKQNDRAILLKQNFTRYMSRHQKVFVLNLTPEQLSRSQKGRKGPKWGKIIDKTIGLYFQNKSWQAVLIGPNIIFGLDLYPKDSPVGPKKKEKRVPNRAELKHV